MNIATQVVVRMGIDAGHTVLGVFGGFEGLISGDIVEMDWQSVSGWAMNGGSNLSIKNQFAFIHFNFNFNLDC